VRRGLSFLVIAFVALLAAPASAASTQGVLIHGFAYDPPALNINQGDTVQWTNGDPVGHSVTADDGSFDSSSDNCNSSDPTGESCIKPDTPFTHTFEESGTFAYHCRVHSSMHGTVVVEAPATTTSSTTTTTTAPTTTTSSTTTTTSSTTTTTTSTTLASTGSVAIAQPGNGDGGSSALPLILGGLVVLAAIAGGAYYAWQRNAEPYDDDVHDWTQEPPPTQQGPSI
jgi:plastocyanin